MEDSNEKPLDVEGIPIERGGSVRGKFDCKRYKTLTPVEAINLNLIVDSSQYPWHAYTGKTTVNPTDYTRAPLDLVVPVFTDIEANLREAIQNALADLESIRLQTNLPNTIDRIIENLTESLVLNTHGSL